MQNTQYKKIADLAFFFRKKHDINLSKNNEDNYQITIDNYDILTIYPYFQNMTLITKKANEFDIEIISKIANRNLLAKYKSVHENKNIYYWSSLINEDEDIKNLKNSEQKGAIKDLVIYKQTNFTYKKR